VFRSLVPAQEEALREDDTSRWCMSNSCARPRGSFSRRRYAEKMCSESLCSPKRKHVEEVYGRHLDQLSSVTSETCSDNKGNLPRWAKPKPEKNRR
jgi:hypothetical protein